MKKEKIRCDWPGEDSLMIQYHDEEWGVPVHNERRLFEFLLLEGFQAGLSWSTILRKRKNFKNAFKNYDYKRIAGFTKKDVARLLKDEGIIRNRLKIESAKSNAIAFIKVQKEFGSFDAYIWSFVRGKSKKNKFKGMREIPASTVISDAASLDLKKRGFCFVGTTIIYAFMQATGMVNDHVTSCFRYNQV